MSTSKNEVLEAMLWLTIGNRHEFLSREWQVQCWKGSTYMMGKASEVGRNWREGEVSSVSYRAKEFPLQLPTPISRLSLTQAFHEKEPWKVKGSQHLVEPSYTKGWEESMWITQRRGGMFGSPPCPYFFEAQFWNHTGHIHWMECSRIHWIEFKKEAESTS